MKSIVLKKHIFLAIVLLVSLHMGSQNSSEQVNRLKRAISIFNFAEQVVYNDTNTNSHFIIGVLGKERTIIDLRALSEKRQLKGKPVRILNFSAVKDITDVDLVYVNYNKGFDVGYILNKISGNNTLLITEDYPYNASMINIVKVDNRFEYEINEAILNENNISVPASLRIGAISSIEKWKQHFQDYEKKLEKSNEQLDKTKTEIKLKEQEIRNQKEAINKKVSKIETQGEALQSKQNQIEALKLVSEFRKKKYSEKIIIERELETRILKQLDALKSSQQHIELASEKIETQNRILSKQKEDITVKESRLKSINKELDNQRIISYLLILLSAIALISGLLIYKNNRSIKRLNSALKEKNDNIYNQSLILASKNKELEEFAYITSHDLKEPLATISGLIELLRDDYDDKLDEDAKMSMEFIDKSSKRMRSLIDALLEYSRLGKAKHKVFINCNDLLDEVLSDLSNAIQRFNAKVTYNNLPEVAGSKVELRTLFQNLINNAIKFKKPDVDPVVAISCKIIAPEEQSRSYFQFQVTDNGIGIQEQHKEKVFAIFQRLNSREEYEGTGIGLAYCKKIVESLGGQIWFESEFGKGTTFYFTIPKQSQLT